MNEANYPARRRGCRSHRRCWRSAGVDRTAHFPRREISVTVVNRDPWHSIRVRNYESDLSDVRVPLDAVLGPIGVLTYDGLVFVLGSELIRPEIVHWRVSGRNPLRW